MSFSYSLSLLGNGKSISDGGCQKTRSLDLVGGSLDLQIGSLLPSGMDSGEMSLGLGRHLGLGFFYGNPDLWGYQSGGIVFHFGLGLGLPINFTHTNGETSKCCQ
jgi:hypothetical protein